VAIEDGLVGFIQSGLGSPPIAVGGFGVMLPKDFIQPSNPMAWVYQSLSSEPTYYLTGQDSFTSLTLRINCHGYTMAYAIQLARAINLVLRGIPSGRLPDSEGTMVYGIFREPSFVDGFDPTNRSFVRTLEYLVNYREWPSLLDLTDAELAALTNAQLAELTN
jgi:hypothetical protein